MPKTTRRAVPSLLALALCGARAASQAPGPLELERGDVLCLVGNALAERMQHHGWLEVELQRRFPGGELAVRNLGFAGDELTVHQRTMNFGKFTKDGMALNLANDRFEPWDRYLDHCDAAVVLACFGFNESFAGPTGVEAFRADLASFVAHVRAQRYDGVDPPELVLVGPPACEDRGDPDLPAATEQNARLAPYSAAMAEVAAELGVRFVDLFGPMSARYAASEGPLTIDGIHLNERGNAAVAEVLAQALFPDLAPADVDVAALRAAVLEKDRLWFERYHATDGYNVYGGRSREVYTASATGEAFSNWDVLQREMDHLDALCASRDREIQALARGERAQRDDSNAPPLIQVLTNKPGEGPHGEFTFLSGEEAVERMTPAPGLRVELFADEARFPELAKPVQMAFDPRGRLWVATWPTYPHWTPGEPMDDQLVVLTDVDGDGRADELTAFADDLHNPTGFEFWKGGVFVASAPDILFLEDTDGDGRADKRERVLHGLSSADTHHSANSFVLGPDGALYFQEGTFHMSQVESVHGPVRNRDGCVWRFEPRTFEVERYVPYNFANPHGHVFDGWGQDFVTDGTGNENYYALPFSGHLPEPAKHRGYFTFFRQTSRPCAATEILSSRHFPPEYQGSYLAANVIGFQGIFQYRVVDDGSGFGAEELAPIVSSTDRNFRPVDLEVGPDGALYFLDWQNPLIGHLQHHLRDPSRDAVHGRVYRVTCPDRPLLEPVPIAGQPIEVLMEALKSPEDRVRYRARIELSARDTDEIVAAARAWVEGLDPGEADGEHHLLEALWLQQQHNRMDRELLGRLLRARDPRARAAATRVLRYGRELVPDALELLAVQVADESARVRLEAVVAASFFDSAEAAWIALGALASPTDRFLDYALAETMRGLEPRWREALRAGRGPSIEEPAAIAFLLERLGPEEIGALPRLPIVLVAIATSAGVDASARAQALDELAAANGTTRGAQILACVREVDGGSSPHAAHVLRELGALLLAGPGAPDGPPRAALVELAEHGRQPATRALGYAALVVHDGGPPSAWSAACTSDEGLRSFLAAVPLVPARETRGALFELVRPVQFTLPPGLEVAGAGSGLEVDFYAPPPSDALRASFEALAPRATLAADCFTLDLPAMRAPDAFALAFRGTLHVAQAGEYTFRTLSDDGSRLYLGERCVVDNDGDHSLLAKEGRIELAAGAHPLLLTYYDAGGAEGLEVSWSGPGFGMQPIPASALGGSDASATRAMAIRAAASIGGYAREKLADAARLLAERGALEATLELVRSVPRAEREAAESRAILDTLTGLVAGLAPEERTSPDVAAALELGRELAASLPAEESAAAVARLAGLGGAIVLVRTLPHQMLYDVVEFEVAAGEPVSIVFQNNDVMPHNLVVTAPGALVAVGEAAELLSGQAGAERSSFIPAHDAVLWHTALLMPGQSERLSFVAPKTPGDHPFVCTYPGHWRVMNGVMHVITELEGERRVARRASDEAPAPSRSFVRDWTVAELLPLFVDGWEREHSAERGRALFAEAGCIKCHAVAGEGATAGPELTKIREKYCAEESLLRHVIEPSSEVLPEYVFYAFELDDGLVVIGRILSDEGDHLRVATALLAPDQVTLVPKSAVVEQRDTVLSPMPSGLLVTFTREEILDLARFLQAPAGE